MRATSRAVHLALWAALVGAACSGGVKHTDIIPTLPRDGDAHTAKPPPMPAATEPEDPWAGRDDLIAAPEPKPAQALELPPVERFTLPNGLEVIAIREERLPVVGMYLAVRAGSRDVTRDKVGLAEFTASMLSMGTSSKSALQIAETVDQVGATLSATPGFEATTISCSALVEHLRTCVGSLADIAVNPSFPKAEMEIVRGQLMTVVQRRKDDAAAMANAHMYNLLWGDDNVRGWPMSLTTIGNITRADLVAWHRALFAPNNALLIVAGKVDVKTLRAELMRSQLRWWQKRKVSRRASDPEPQPQGARIRLVDKPGQTQTQIRIAQLGIAHGDPDYHDHLVMNYVLGGGAFSSRLMRVVRSQTGQTYSVSSRFEANQERGAFVISTFTRNEGALRTIDLILGELATMKQKGPSDAEVAGAISYITGNYLTRFEAPADIASAVLVAELHGLGQDHVRDYPLAVAKVTTGSAAQAAAKTLDPSKLAIVLVGDAKDLIPQLERVGWNYERVDYRSPVAAYERAALAEASVDPKAKEAGRDLLARALAAKGGAAKLRAIKTMTVRASGTIAIQGRSLPASFTRRYAAPDRLRMDIELDLGGAKAQVITVLDRDKAWNQQPGQSPTLLPDEAVAEFHKQLWRDHEFILLHAQDKGVQIEGMGRTTIEGEELDAVRVVPPGTEAQVVLFLDPKTHLIRRLLYTEAGVQGTETFSDYRAVRGIQVAHERLTSSPDANLQVKVTSVSFDESLTNAVFALPE